MKAFGVSKAHYRPIEAAIRWTGLWKREREILAILQTRHIPEPDDFPQWPVLRLKVKLIYDAMRNGDLAYCINGLQAPEETPFDHPDVTVRHDVLKEWMQRYHPDQRPRFLFSKLERGVQPSITIHDVRALTFERDSLKVLVSERDAEIAALRLELRALLKSLDAPPRRNPTESLSERAETVYLHIIGGQNELLLGKDPSGKTYSKFRTQEDIIAELTARHDGRLGITKSTLENKFALANRALSGRP